MNLGTFTNNYSKIQGGAISVWATAILNKCVFTGNQAITSGGAISTVLGPNSVTSCRFSGNRAGSLGGALSGGNSSDSRDFLSCLFSGNKAGTSGGAVSFYNTGSTVNFRNCTFAGDSATNGNALNTTGIPLLQNCIVWDGAGNSKFSGTGVPSVNYSIVQGGYAGIGNTAANPLFTAPLMASAAPATGGNYALQSCSPAVNSGSNTGSYAGQLDAAGTTRLIAGVVDRGAYELQTPPAGILTNSNISNSVCVGSGIQLTATMPGGT